MTARQFIIDAGMFAGEQLPTGYYHSIEAVVEDMDRRGVAVGLVGSYRAIYLDEREGNREAADWARRFPGRIEPLGMVHPVVYGDEPEELFRWMHGELGIRVVGMFSDPSVYKVFWDSPAVTRVGEAAQKLGMVVQVGVRDEGELASVARSLGAIETPIIVRFIAGRGYKMVASALAVAARHPNFVFDLGAMCSTGLVRLLAERIGADRLVFASNAPENVALAPQALLEESGLDTDAYSAIAHGTMLRLLPHLERPGLGAPASVFAGEAWQALRTRSKVDVHWHPDGWNLAEPMLGEQEQIATFDRFGYERVIVFASRALRYDLEGGNAVTAAWFDKDPRVHGLIVVNPLHLEESLAEIDRYAPNDRFVGLKSIQDVFGIGLDDPCYDPILRRASELGLPMLAHLPGIGGAARKFPGITFIAAHSNWERAHGLVDVPNVCFDFATSHALRAETQLRRFIDAIGPERVLFGADGQLINPAWSLAKLLDAGASEAELDLILRENAYRVFPRLRGGERAVAPERRSTATQ